MSWKINSSESPLEQAQSFLEAMISDDTYKGHDLALWRDHAKILCASVPPASEFPTVTVRLEVTESMTNRGANLHGGMAATIFDCVTSIPLRFIAREGFWMLAGVSRTLAVTYLRPVAVGEMVDVVAEVISAGARLASIRGTMKRVRDGAIVATCVHDKANVDLPVSNI